MRQAQSNERVCWPDRVRLVVDPLIPEHQLRPIGLLCYFGFDTYTYPYSWRLLGERSGENANADRSLIPHSWIPDEEIGSAVMAGKRLAVLAQSVIEDGSPRYSLSAILETCDNVGSNGRLCIVADREDFQLHGGLRPLRHENWVSLSRFDEIYQRVSEWYSDHDCDLPLKDCKSIYFQSQACVYEMVTNARVKTMEGLMHEMLNAPFLPIWEDLGRALSYGEEMPTFNAVDLCEWLMRYVEVDPRSRSLRELCNGILDEKCQVLNSSWRRHVTKRD